MAVVTDTAAEGMAAVKDCNSVRGGSLPVCGRYYLAHSNADQPSDELNRIIAALNRKKTPASLKTSGEIFPSDIVPVLANNRQMEIEPFAMRWGYSFPNSRPIINARSETASLKALFKDGMLQRRCLIPASNYFEWGWSDNRAV